MREIGAEEWASIADRLEIKEGGFDKSGFALWLTAPGVEEKIVERFGEGWTLEQAYTLATGGSVHVKRSGRRSRRNERVEEGAVALGSQGALVKIDDLETRIEARVNEYLEDFDGVSVNDRASIRDLASAEIVLGEINRLRLLELAQEFPSDDRLRRLTESASVLSKQTRDLQTILEISRKQRNEKGRQRDSVTEVMDLIEDMGEWVKRRSVRLKDGSRMLGWLVPLFPEFRHVVRIEMPEKGWIEIPYEPTPKAKEALEPEWVRKEENRYQEPRAELAQEEERPEPVQNVLKRW